MDEKLNNSDNKQTFEWDEHKNILNIGKHGISFEDASKVFNDEKRLDLPDKKHSQQEERRIVIGMVEKIIFVVYTKRVKNVRIISARTANEKERRWYDNNNN